MFLKKITLDSDSTYCYVQQIVKKKERHLLFKNKASTKGRCGFQQQMQNPFPHDSKFLRIQTKKVDFDIYILVLGICSWAEMCHGRCAMKESTWENNVEEQKQKQKLQIVRVQMY